MRRAYVVCGLLGIILSACAVAQRGEPTPAPTHDEIPYMALPLMTVGPAALTDPGVPGCTLANLRPFHWKEVDSGLVDIRTPEEYAVQTESLYQEGYLDYRQARLKNPDRYRSTSEMSYEAYLALCNVFPKVDFEQYSVLGAQAAGTGCTVNFAKRVYRDKASEKILYAITVVEEGACDMEVLDRNLILVPRIAPEYSVEFLISG